MFKRFNLLLIFIFSTSVSAESVQECGPKCQEGVVEQYFSQLSRVYQRDSKVSHIDQLFNNMSKEVRYEHLVYGANFNRDEWKDAFIRNQKSGTYKNEANQEIRVENYIHGKGHVAVAYSYGIRKTDGSWVPKGDQSLMALFSLQNGKIKSVKEYW